MPTPGRPPCHGLGRVQPELLLVIGLFGSTLTRAAEDSILHLTRLGSI